MSWDDIPEDGSTAARPIDPWPGIVAGLALLMGIGSILMSFLISGNFGLGVVYYVWFDDLSGRMGQSWRTLVFQLTKPWPMTCLFGWVAVAWCLGFAGYRLGRARLDPNRRASLAATAARFSTWGLVGCGLDFTILAGMLTYRFDRWYFG